MSHWHRNTFNRFVMLIIVKPNIKQAIASPKEPCSNIPLLFLFNLARLIFCFYREAVCLECWCILLHSDMPSSKFIWHETEGESFFSASFDVSNGSEKHQKYFIYYFSRAFGRTSEKKDEEVARRFFSLPRTLFSLAKQQQNAIGTMMFKK